MPETLKYSEQQLVELLKKHDNGAFSYLYDSCSPAIYGIILKMVNSEETAREVMREVFVKIWNTIPTYERAKGKLFTWMVNIARNSSIDALRSGQPLEPSVTEVSKKGASGKIEYAGLADVVKKLKDEQQVLIDMVYLKGYTHEAVAKELNLPVATVKTRIRAAMLKLREILT